jgi:hypothetical protein
VFLKDGFAKICAENSIPSHVKQPWPEEGIIDLLVQRSSGQFIYAATVLKFVGADFCSPTKQLALVLKPDPTAFSDLDHLYTQILLIYPSTVNIDRVLGIIILFAHASFRDYLFDSSRSGPFHVNQQEYENRVTVRSFALILQLIWSWRQVIIMIFNLLTIQDVFYHPGSTYRNLGLF